MHKKHCFVLFLSLALLLCACTASPGRESLPTPTPTPVLSPTPEVSPSAAPLPTTPTPLPPAEEVPETAPPADVPDEPEPTPEHSDLYLPAYSREQVTEYFGEVVLDAEYTDGSGDATRVQKWLRPIRYRYYGTPTDTDIEILQNLFDQLNAIPGFPGIGPAQEGFKENLSISFLEPEEFRSAFAEVIGGSDAYGAVHYWYYTATNELYSARIGYRSDIEQSVRNSVLPEEVINGLGITDTVMRTDSITYQYSNDNTALSDMDWLIVKLLYDPAIECGMDADACAAVIAQLYY